MKARDYKLWVALGAFIIVMFLAKPASFWEFDEPLFAQAIHHYDPVSHHPPPPGYPVFIFVARLFRMILPSDYAALVTLSFLASAIAFVMLARAFGVLASVLFYFSPAMLVHSTLPISEPGALALLSSAVYCMPNSPGLFGAFAALTVGWRPQFAIFVVPLLFARMNLKAIIVFTLVCLCWFVPLTMAVGGFQNLLRFEAGQAEYFAEHDASVSRGGWSTGPIVARFIADPWGPPVMSIPLLIIAAIGARKMWRTPLAIAAIVYIAFAFAVMDPADGVRYAIPFTLVIALCAATALMRFRRPFAIATLFAAGAIVYTSSLLVQRSTSPSPALVVARSVQPNAVVLYELPLWPHATYWLANHPLARVDNGLHQYFDAPSTPLALYAEGQSRAPGATNARWVPSEAYATLTRNKYRTASITPLTPDRRFNPVRGIYAPEREPEGDEWRWLDVDAELQLPAGAKAVVLTLGLPANARIEDNVVTIGTQRIRVLRGQKVRVVVPVASSALRITSARSYRAEPDPRRLAVRLHDLVVQQVSQPARRAA